MEAKLAALSLGDEPSLVSDVKAKGIEKSGLAANIHALAAKAESKDEAEALAGLALVKALATEAPDAQMATKHCLGACLEQGGSKSKNVRAAAQEAALAICTNINAFAMKSLLPDIFSKLPVEKNWQVRELALHALHPLEKNSPNNSEMPSQSLSPKLPPVCGIPRSKSRRLLPKPCVRH